MDGPFVRFSGGPFRFGDRVRKKKGSEWQGRVCGGYSTALTPIGYNVESENHAGSVQIYPASALERVAELDAVDRWIAEFATISPVDITGMDFLKAARVAVDFGFSPRQVLGIIEKMDRDQIADLAGRNPE